MVPATLGAIGRNRRRYGGYIVHAGIAILLVGIGASSSFQTNRDLRLDVGESATVGDYEVTYERLTTDPQNERIAFIATLDVRKDGEPFALLAPARNYYPTQNPMAGPIGRFFDGEATSEIGLKSGAGEDFWTAFQPDLSVLDDDIARGNRQLADLPPEAQGVAILALAERYAQDPPPATFRVIVNPLVMWLWIGALVSLAGALLALWPSAEARRRAQAAYAARLGKELGATAGAGSRR
jgi:cytochrome c-type biogenesis protein CcmF